VRSAIFRTGGRHDETAGGNPEYASGTKDRGAAAAKSNRQETGAPSMARARRKSGAVELMSRASDKNQLELLPAGYLQAREMLARATRIDEVKKIRDKSVAFGAYAAVIKDRENELLCAELRMRSERRAGQMLIEAKASGEFQPGRPKLIVPGGNYFYDTLKRLNISNKESMHWQRRAKLSERDFEKLIRRMREPGNGFIKNGAFSSDSSEWLSPPEVLEAVYDVLGEVDLDPCSNARGARANVKANKHFIKEDDGLAQPWRGRVYMNPPYGSFVAAWCERITIAYGAGEIAEAIALIAARTDNPWFRLFDDFPVCLVAGRLHFSGHENGAMFPSAIFYLGKKNVAQFEERFAQLGSVRPPASVSYRPATSTSAAGEIDG
jgi:hypothetical protein